MICIQEKLPNRVIISWLRLLGGYSKNVQVISLVFQNWQLMEASKVNSGIGTDRFSGRDLAVFKALWDLMPVTS